MILFRAKNNSYWTRFFFFIFISYIISFRVAIFSSQHFTRTLESGVAGEGGGVSLLSNVLHRWANRFKTIMPRNRKLKMTVADTEQRYAPLMMPSYPPPTQSLSHSLITTVLWAPDYATVFRYKRLNVLRNVSTHSTQGCRGPRSSSPLSERAVCSTC